jgi:hypothetical protein
MEGAEELAALVVGQTLVVIKMQVAVLLVVAEEKLDLALLRQQANLLDIYTDTLLMEDVVEVLLAQDM